tara:strand:+ start:1018 stop:6366 length:5349 start_codon:yes stop_codon:yes gene_type:complete
MVIRAGIAAGKELVKQAVKKSKYDSLGRINNKKIFDSARYRKIQAEVDRRASNFKIDDKKTWRGIVDTYGDASSTKSLQFILPSTKHKEARKFVLDDIKRRAGNAAQTGGPGAKVDANLSWPGFIKKFKPKTYKTFQKDPGLAVKNLGMKTIDKAHSKWHTVFGKGTGVSDKGKQPYHLLMARIKKLRTEEDYNKYWRLLNRRKDELNKLLGNKPNSPKSLQLEHTRSFIDLLRMRGITTADDYLNVSDDVLREILREADKLTNIKFGRRKANLLKAEMFERRKGDKSIIRRWENFNKDKELWQSLKRSGQGESKKAINLESKMAKNLGDMKRDVKDFQLAMTKEYEEGFGIAYDTRKYTRHLDDLPPFARIKNEYVLPIRGDTQLHGMFVERGYNPLFDPKLTTRNAPNITKGSGSNIMPVRRNPNYEEGGRVEYADGPSPEGVQPIESPKTTFDSEVRQMMDLTGLGLGDSVLEIMKDRASANPGRRKNFKIGGIVGTEQQAGSGGYSLDNTNKVGAVESLLAGIASGLIDIPKGAFTLGAALMDLGWGTNNAAKVSEWFDDLTEFDEKAEEHWLGTFAKVGVNLGVPGAYGWKAGEKLARTALLAKRNGNYFKLTDPELVKKFNTSLNAKGRLLATLGAAGGAGITDAIFVGDPEGIGTFGDMIGGGPTELQQNDSKIASREIVNRMKFGLDGSLMLGLIGGTGSAVKSLYRRRNDLKNNNDAIDKFLGAFRPRGQKSQAFFDMERRNLGARSGDVNYAAEQARKLDKHIDAIFPFVKNPFNKLGNKGRTEFMDDLNETLLSGDVTMNSIGKVDFGPMDKTLVDKVTGIMKGKGAQQKDIEGVFDSFEQMRLGWGHIFSRLGYSMDDELRKGFAPLFGKKMRDYLGATYEMFQNKSLIPLMRYKPSEEVVEKTIKIFQESAEESGNPITREQAEFYANQVVETAKPARDLATSKERTTGIYFDAPDFFVNKTVLSEIEGAKATVALEDLIPEVRGVFDELFGKVKDPMQTMLTGTNRLSVIGRRNQLYNELLQADKELIPQRAKLLAEDPNAVIPVSMRGFFRETEKEAVSDFGKNIKKIEIDPSRTIEAGITNPLNGKYAEKGVAEAIEESAMISRDKSTLQQLYDSFILYPKATSQMAKTILSPVTHVRNFVSAGAFASSNGLFLQRPDDIATAMKDAFRHLQIPGSRMANEEYRKLLRLGVVNSNVRLGDLTKLLKDTNFGESVNSRTALRNLMRPLSKTKKWTEDMYTAEDDFWKITSYALERQRLDKAYKKYGINKTLDELDEEAADLIRNQIPNYDMVNDFIRATRKLPLGNFVSFPAEIMRTTANILQRGLKEINMTHTLDDGRIVRPLREIGYKRLFGLGTTVVAIPYGTVEAAKAIYDVSDDEMEALRRFVPDWSKNSTLVPIKGEDGELKYVDFSHANAYDTMIRPITAMVTGVQRGMAEGDLGQEVMKSMWEGTAETLSPFVSESIWTTAISDIFLRGGRTREGNRLWTDETPWGERMNKALMHALKTQFPGSIETFKRMDLAIEPVDIIMKGKYDKYGQSFEFGDELAGFAGLRAVKVDPIRAMKFKIADFRTGVNNARREFTSPLLRGGPITPEQIVDRYKIASDALYKVQEKMFRDYQAALTLGTGVDRLDLEFADRVSNVQLDAIKRGLFKPFIPSENIEKAFQDNARAIGDPDPYRAARNLIRRLIRLYEGMPLGLRLPTLENPFRTSGLGQLPIAGSPAFTGITTPMQNPGSITIGAPNNPQQTAMAGQQVFGANDSIFGVG